MSQDAGRAWRHNHDANDITRSDDEWDNSVQLIYTIYDIEYSELVTIPIKTVGKIIGKLWAFRVDGDNGATFDLTYDGATAFGAVAGDSGWQYLTGSSRVDVADEGELAIDFTVGSGTGAYTFHIGIIVD